MGIDRMGDRTYLMGRPGSERARRGSIHDGSLPWPVGARSTVDGAAFCFYKEVGGEGEDR